MLRYPQCYDILRCYDIRDIPVLNPITVTIALIVAEEKDEKDPKSITTYDKTDIPFISSKSINFCDYVQRLAMKNNPLSIRDAKKIEKAPDIHTSYCHFLFS